MATNKKEVAKGLAGLPAQEAMLMPKNFDKVPAMVKSADGTQEAPAALTEGEFVFSVPALIALGEGDHQKGIEMITQLHDLLREKSKDFIDQKGLAAAGLSEDG